MEEIIQTTIATTIDEVIEYSNLLCFDRATLVLSIIAILISIWSVFWTNYKNNKSSYKNNLYDDILKEALHNRLPGFIQNSIDLNRKTVNDLEIDRFQDFLGELRVNLLVFKYIDNKFYKKVDEIILKIEDNIVLMINKKENFDKRYEELICQVKKLYKCVEKYLFK